MTGLLVDCVWYRKMNKPWSSDVIYKHEQEVGRRTTCCGGCFHALQRAFVILTNAIVTRIATVD